MKKILVLLIILLSCSISCSNTGQRGVKSVLIREYEVESHFGESFLSDDPEMKLLEYNPDGHLIKYYRYLTEGVIWYRMEFEYYDHKIIEFYYDGNQEKPSYEATYFFDSNNHFLGYKRDDRNIEKSVNEMDYGDYPILGYPMEVFYSVFWSSRFESSNDVVYKYDSGLLREVELLDGGGITKFEYTFW